MIYVNDTLMSIVLVTMCRVFMMTLTSLESSGPGLMLLYETMTVIKPVTRRKGRSRGANDCRFLLEESKKLLNPNFAESECWSRAKDSNAMQVDPKLALPFFLPSSSFGVVFNPWPPTHLAVMAPVGVLREEISALECPTLEWWCSE